MKVKVEILAIVFLLFCASAWASTWTVDSFDDSPDPGEPDKYIAGESGNDLKPVQPSQVTPQSGRLYVRQKFEDAFGDEEATYQIFQGRATEAAKGLGKVSLEGIPYQTLLKMKLFYTKSASGDDDLETVYYDGKDIYVEGEDPVYMNLNGRMEEFKPIASREYEISVTSDPSGANITVGGVSKGQTPTTFTVPSAKTVALVVSKDGYYTIVKLVTPVSGKATQEGILLTQRVPLENQAQTYKSKLQTAVANKDANEVKNIKANVQKAVNSFSSESKKSIDAIMAKFPANPAKAASESSTEYSARQSIWTNAQARERDALNKEAQNNFIELKDLLVDIDAAVGDMDFVLKYEYIPNSAISITNLGVKDFSLNAEISNSRVDFKYNKAKLAYGSVPRNEVAEDQESVHGVLKIWNVPNESGKYASIYDIAFFYNETPLKILTKGSFTMGQATSASRSTEKDLNSRIAKYSGKAAWDKRDEGATLDALRSGEVSGGSSAKKSAPSPVEEYGEEEEDSAYYDEDEDDEEYEQGVQDQEEYDYARYGATSSAKDVFGNTDEYLFWTGVLFAAAAIGTGVFGYLQFSKFKDASDKYNVADAEERRIENFIIEQCGESNRNDPCSKFYIKKAQDISNEVDGVPANGLYWTKLAKDTNGATRDSYKTSFISWWSGAAVSAALSIVFFAW